MKTYVIKTIGNEYYCGKTNNIDRRMQEHLNEKRPHWFALRNSRKDFIIDFQIDGDYEKNIKRFGVKKFMRCLRP